MRSGLPLAFCAHAEAMSAQGQLTLRTVAECEGEFVVAHLLQVIDERGHDSSEANRLTSCIDDGCLGAGCRHSPTVRSTPVYARRLTREAH